MAQQGKKYVWGAAGPRAFDCSGLVMQAFAQVGIKLPHYTGTMIKYGTKVARKDLKRGDILFPTSGHVVIYLGNGMQLAASSGKGMVTIQKIYGFYAARRLL
jgi:cell wall-associated NlpC family hydrolase